MDGVGWLLFFVWVLAYASAAWVIVDVLYRNRNAGKIAKVIWIVCALLFSFSAAMAYFVLEKLD